MIIVYIRGDANSAGEGWCSGLEKHIVHPTPPTCSVNTARREGSQLVPGLRHPEICS